MEHVCPIEIINHIHGFTTTEAAPTTTSTTTTTTTKSPFIRTRVTKKIKVRSHMFNCVFILTHTRTTITRSYVKCNPNKPKNQKAKKILLATKDYTFRVNLHINPSRLTLAKIIRSPPTEPPTTTSTTST